ncbi:MAG: glycosyltransferase family 4 protein [Acidobacteriota bacterium]
MGDRRLAVMNLISGNGRGGSDRLALDLSVGLKERGHRVIFGAPADCYLSREAEHTNVQTFNLYPSGNIDMAGLNELVQFCNKEAIDILNAHHSHSRHLLLVAKFRGLKAKIVFTRHCILNTVPFFGALPSNLVVDMNIAVSNAVANSLIRSGIFRRRVRLVYGSVDTQKFQGIPHQTVEEYKARYFAGGYDFVIGMVARLIHDGNFDPAMPTPKGHDVLIRAVAQLDNRTAILFLGPCLERDIEKLHLMARHYGLPEERLIFAGFQEDMAPFYQMMDLAVLPSPHEGLGLAIIEAMAAGVPCIGANSGGVAEIITHGKDGFLVKPGDSAELAEKIAALRSSAPLREEFAAEGKKTVAARFDLALMAERTEEVFSQLVSDN